MNIRHWFRGRHSPVLALTSRKNPSCCIIPRRGDLKTPTRKSLKMCTACWIQGIGIYPERPPKHHILIHYITALGHSLICHCRRRCSASKSAPSFRHECTSRLESKARCIVSMRHWDFLMVALVLQVLRCICTKEQVGHLTMLHLSIEVPRTCEDFFCERKKKSLKKSVVLRFIFAGGRAATVCILWQCANRRAARIFWVVILGRLRCFVFCCWSQLLADVNNACASPSL